MNSSDANTINQALNILSRELRQPGAVLSSPEAVKQFLTLKLAREEREVFGALWLNVQNAVIASDDLFYGTLTQAAVYPREVLKAALMCNAASLICYHNHPSGRCLPSDADLHLTARLKEGLEMIDVRLLDHIIVGGMTTYSFAEHSKI